MSSRAAIGAGTAAALLAAGLPVFFAIALAKRQGLETVAQRTLVYARDIVRRSDATGDQIVAGMQKLLAAPADDPCSDARIEMMRQIDLGSSYIQTIGRTFEGRLMCSSLGRHGDGLSLGPVDYVSSTGTADRYDVHFPFAADSSFLVLERDGYAAIIHKDVPIDVSTEEHDVLLAVVRDRERVMVARGVIRPRWIDRLDGQLEATFVDDGYVVAVVRSGRGPFAAIAAEPVSYADGQVRAVSMVLIPIGLVAGGVMAFAVIYAARQQLALPAVLKAALRRNEFYLAYQPMVALRDGRWVGAEVLIRWDRPGGEAVRADLFIQVAEDTGLIQRITERVIELVGRDAALLFARFPDCHLSINLSGADLQSPRTVELFRRLAHETKAGPANLLVEATERSLAQTEATRGVIRDLRAIGIRVAIDDFGTGYSNLSSLQSFDLDILKIDKSFVDALGTEAPTSEVALHIIEMAKKLKLQMVAEGVETIGQAHFLRDRGVQYGQGWLFGKPMPFAAFTESLERQNVITPT